MTYLISIASMYECASLDIYINSLVNLKGSVDKLVSIEFPEYISDIYPLSCHLNSISIKIKDEKSYPGNLFRFAFFPMGMNPKDICVFTDTHDVFFQTKFPVFKKNKIYVGRENIKWKDSEFWYPILKKFGITNLDNEEVYCMGAWAMSFEKTYQLMDFLRINQKMFNYANWSDQILFNLWLQTQKKNIEESPSFIANMFNGYNTKDILIKNKKIVNKKGDLFSICHFNGNTKELYELL
jgi:hypothetical protein